MALAAFAASGCGSEKKAYDRTAGTFVGSGKAAVDVELKATSVLKTEQGVFVARFGVTNVSDKSLQVLYDRSELEQVKNVEESAGLARRAADIRTHLKFLLESTDPNTVFWIERRVTAGVKNFARNQRQGAPSMTASSSWVGM